MEGKCVVNGELDPVIRAALSYQALAMADSHAYYDAAIEVQEEILREAMIEFVESNYAVMVPRPKA